MRRALPLLLLAIAATASARVLPAGRLGRGITTQAVQHRANRHFAIISAGKLVLYDAKEEEEPTVIPVPGYGVLFAAVREDETQLAILVRLSSDYGYYLSVDRGATWKHIDGSDDLRIGTHEFPFIYQRSSGIYTIAATGETKLLVKRDPSERPVMIGSSRDGSRILLLHYGYFGEPDPTTSILILDLDGTTRKVGTMPAYCPCEGWITPDGAAYVANDRSDESALYYAANGTTTRVSGTEDPGTVRFVAVPSADYAGAWMAQRTPAATTLSFHSPATGLVTQWTDASAPHIVALHPGASGQSMLIQLDDAAFALWRRGEPPPASYDRMLVPTQRNQAIVHVDPDRLERGEIVVLDTGRAVITADLTIAPPDDWGTFRTSYAQRLILPAAARTAGAYGSFWTTDVTLYNASDRGVNVAVRYAPATGGEGASATIALAAREIRAVADILHALFGLDSGNGSRQFTPDVGATIDVASRTYSTSAAGTSGFAMDAIDARDALGPTSRATFSGAVTGAGYRTNLTLTAMSPHDVAVDLYALGFGETLPRSFITPAGGQRRLDFVAETLGISPAFSASLVVEPTAGETIAAAFAIDDRTNDASYFPPDTDLMTERIFPIVGHVDGAHGSHFRTDLYILRTDYSLEPTGVDLNATLWDGTKQSGAGWGGLAGLTVIPDVFAKLFKGEAGVARLRVVPFAEWGKGTELHVAARTYTVDADGGTHGFVMPPLTKSGIAAAGETLEILGTAPDSRFRTNLGLVDASTCDDCTLRPRVRIELVDRRGATIDAFDAELPAGGGRQIDDLFHARGIDAKEPVLIRITVVNGVAGAYAATLDNGTNDAAIFMAKKR